MPIKKTNFARAKKTLAENTLHPWSSVDSNVGSTIVPLIRQSTAFTQASQKWSQHHSCHSQLNTTEAVHDAACLTLLPF